METQVGIVGLGAMGASAARRLEEMGFGLVVFDSRPAQMSAFPKAVPAGSVQELARRSDVILAFLPYSSDVEAVAIDPGGVIDGA